MSKVLVLYYSSYAHTERMAQAVAEGVREACAEADIKRVPELVPEDVAKKSGYKLDQAAPIAAVAELPNYDAIVFGSGTRFGVVTSQMRNFLDQTGGLWAKGALVGKVGSVFTGSGTQHGGQESIILSMIPTLLHHGMIVVGLPYSFEGQSRHDEITGCSPYGASTITRPDGSRMPSENELAGARFQGRHVAHIAGKLQKWTLLSAETSDFARTYRPMDLGGGGIVHATKFGQQAAAGYMRQPITPQPIPSRIYMQRDASSFAVGAEL